MTLSKLASLKLWARRAMLTLTASSVAVSALGVYLWHSRADLSAIDWPQYPLLEPTVGSVTMTWFGATSLLFDDGETQILIDGFFSRPSVIDALLRRDIEANAAQINTVLEEYRIRRLAAIIPAHSHFDHAMDIGAIANRSSASILGSASSANIARGAGVPEDQILIARDGEQYTFGAFVVTMLQSQHARVGWGGAVPYDGAIESPLQTPAPMSAWRAGESFSILIEHPQGTTLVHASAGYVRHSRLPGSADVVLLGTAMLDGLGKKYAEAYWQAVVTASGAKHVFPIHFDDYLQPLGVIEAAPKVLSDFEEVAAWLEEFRDRWDSDTRLHMPHFGRQLVLFSEASPEA